MSQSKFIYYVPILFQDRVISKTGSLPSEAPNQVPNVEKKIKWVGTIQLPEGAGTSEFKGFAKELLGLGHGIQAG